MGSQPINLAVDQLRALAPGAVDELSPPKTGRADRQTKPRFDANRRRDLAIITLRKLEGLTKQQVCGVLESALAMLDC